MKRLGLIVCLSLWGVGCGSSEDEAPVAAEASEKEASFSADLMAKTWPVQVMDETAMAPFASHGGWAQLTGQHRLDQAVGAFSKQGGLSPEAAARASSRAHAETAGLFRQATLLSANAVIETFGKTLQETDPLGVQHLLTVSYVVSGDLDAARTASAQFLETTETDNPARVWHAPWADWLGGDAVWPPDLSGLPMELPEEENGVWPEAPSTPHYALTEQGESARERKVSDPSALLALALWHERVAVATAADEGELARLYAARYALAAEPDVSHRGELPLEFLFGSDFASPADAAFLQDVLDGGTLQGTFPSGETLESYQDRSVLAVMTHASQRGDQIDSEKALDQAADLRRAVLDAATTKFGKIGAFDRQLGDIVSVGALRSLSLIAEVLGDREAGGILRINAWERSDAHTACPVAIMALAAWDAGNRYPIRATEILHRQTRRYTSLEVARFGLDALAIRVGRETTDQNPGL